METTDLACLPTIYTTARTLALNQPCIQHARLLVLLCLPDQMINAKQALVHLSLRVIIVDRIRSAVIKTLCFDAKAPNQRVANIAPMDATLLLLARMITVIKLIIVCCRKIASFRSG